MTAVLITYFFLMMTREILETPSVAVLNPFKSMEGFRGTKLERDSNFLTTINIKIANDVVLWIYFKL